MNSIIQKQKQFFLTDKTKPYSFRKSQLIKLRQMIENYETDIYDVLKADLNKSEHEAITTEIGILYSEIDFTLKHLKNWMKVEHVPAPFTHKGTKNYIMYEPYGVTLVIAPWNYPVQLALGPVIGAIAAGNTVIIKPSELTGTTANLLQTIISETFPPEFITVVLGDKHVTTSLLNERFDYIFFTGSTNVGKIVMEKASKHLTPVTLELGGKSPAIVDENCHIKLTAKRLVWGKFTNVGQTCVAPDYVYVHDRIKTKFINEMKKQIKKMYGKNVFNNENYGRIVNEKHFQRLLSYLDEGKIIYGGQYNQDSLKIEPTLIDDITWDNKIMQEEIFGPLLPIISFRHLSDVIHVIQSKEKPLALYYFGHSNKREQKVLEKLSFGGACINDTLYHLANPYLPFGGVGFSGMGAYHGQYSFETFSHRKSVLKQSTRFDIPIRYPGGKLKKSIVKKIMT